jgi:hypothetical protein
MRREKDAAGRRAAPAALGRERTAPVREMDESPSREAPSVPAPAPPAQAPPPAPTIDPAELEFGFER